MKHCLIADARSTTHALAETPGEYKLRPVWKQACGALLLGASMWGPVMLPAVAQTSVVHPASAQTNTWRTKLHASHSTATGCFQSDYPSTSWKPVSCGAAPNKPMSDIHLRSSIRPLDEMISGDYALKSSTLIQSASGYLNNVQNVSSITRATDGAANQFSLQLNSQSDLPGKVICRQSKTGSCKGWVQFVFSSDGTLYVQSWALDYGPSCPPNLPIIDSRIVDHFSCAVNGPMLHLPQGSPRLSDLSGAVLSGQVFRDSSGNTFDEATLTYGVHAYKTQASPDITGAYGNWTLAEFNVFGNHKANEAIFNGGSLVSVLIAINGDTGGGASCDPARSGTTAESTNLTLGPCGPKVASPTNSAISFIEGVLPVISSFSPVTGSVGSGTEVTITATNANAGFVSNPVVMFGPNRAQVVRCAATTCVVTAPEGRGSVDIRVANAFAGSSSVTVNGDGSIVGDGFGPVSDPAPQKFTYLGPTTCKFSLLSCPAQGGQQEYQVTCPSTVDFKLGAGVQKTGTIFVGSERGSSLETTVSACLPGTSNCQIFTTVATQICPIHPVPPPPTVYPNCIPCDANMQKCVQVFAPKQGYVCTGLRQ